VTHRKREGARRPMLGEGWEVAAQSTERTGYITRKRFSDDDSRLRGHGRRRDSEGKKVGSRKSKAG